jgi:hypothetical protein
MRLRIRIELSLLLGLQKQAIVGIEHDLGQVHQEFFEEPAGIPTFLLDPMFIDEYDSYNLLQIGYLHESRVAILEKLRTSDLDCRLFSVLVLRDICLDLLLKQSCTYFKGYALRHVPDDPLDLFRECGHLHNLLPLDLLDVPLARVHVPLHSE